MYDLEKIIGGAEVGVVVADENKKVIYANEKCKKILKGALGIENFVGQNLTELHNPGIVEKIEVLYKEFESHERSLYHYLIKPPDNSTTTIVIVPFYSGEKFSGTTEFIFESALY